jgi:hypothetical protein
MSVELYINPVEAGIVAVPYTNEELAERCTGEEGSVIADHLTTYILFKNIKLSRGDAVSVIPRAERDRNDGLFFWNGSEVIPLDTTLDEYHGNLPACFQVTDTEFAPDYWFGTIQHNGIFHLSNELLNRFTFETSVGEDGDLTVAAKVWIGSTLWTATVVEPEELDDPENPLSGTPEYFKQLLLNGRFRTEYVGEPNTFELTW